MTALEEKLLKENKQLREDKQKLIDLMFEVGLTINSHTLFQKMDNEELAEWIRKQLKSCDFKTKPVGSSWGVLENNKKDNTIFSLPI
jgi:hypothetical protein